MVKDTETMRVLDSGDQEDGLMGGIDDIPPELKR